MTVQIFKVDWEKVDQRINNKLFEDHYPFTIERSDTMYKSSPQKIDSKLGHRYSNFPPDDKIFSPWVWFEDSYFDRLCKEGHIEKIRLSKTEKAKFLLENIDLRL